MSVSVAPGETAFTVIPLAPLTGTSQSCPTWLLSRILGYPSGYYSLPTRGGSRVLWALNRLNVLARRFPA